MLWIYLCDHCDNAGVWKVDFDLVSFFIGETVDVSCLDDGFASRVCPIDGGAKWWIPSFIHFQCGSTLSEKSGPHRRVLSMLEDHGLREAYETGDFPPSLLDSGAIDDKPKTAPKPRAKRAKAKPETPIPEALDTETFRAAWDRWHKFRSEIGKSLKPSTEAAQIKKFTEWGEALAVQAIEASITNGWQGLFDPREKRGNSQQMAIPAGKPDDSPKGRALAIHKTTGISIGGHLVALGLPRRPMPAADDHETWGRVLARMEADRDGAGVAA